MKSRSIWPLLKTSIGRPARIALVNRNNAMSGRPHGPYTVKKRKPVVGRPEQVAVTVRHQLVGLLRGRVEADRVIDVLMLGKRHALFRRIRWNSTAYTR